MNSPAPFSSPAAAPVIEPSPAVASTRRKLAWWYGFCLAVLGGVAFWAERVLSEYSNDEQRALSGHSTVWGLHACLTLGLLGFCAMLPSLRKFYGRRRLLTGLALAMLGYLACGLAPRTNRIFYDEHIYM